MANVSEQVQKQGGLTENFEALTILDDKNLELGYSEEELSDDFDLSAESPGLSTQDDELEIFLPNFVNHPSVIYYQDRELENLNFALASHDLISIAGTISNFGLAAKLFQDYENPNKFWVDAHISSFIDFAQWAIPFLNPESPKLTETKAISEDRLIDSLVKLFHTHSCLVVINQIDRSQEQQEFWLEFLQSWHKSLTSEASNLVSGQISSKIIVTSQSTLEFTTEFTAEFTSVLQLSAHLSYAESADLLTEMGVIGDRQDLENFGQLLGGQPLSLILAANLLKVEEQIPQIRNLVRYGKIFDLNQPPRNIAFTTQNVFDRSFKRLLPKLRNLLTIASIYAQPFNIGDIQELNSDLELDLADLQKLEQLGLIRELAQNYFICEPQIQELISIPDSKPYQEQIIKYLWTKTKPYFEWESDRDLSPYLAIFDRCCALGEHYRAFYTIHDETEQCVDRYLEAQGKHFRRISLFKPLLAAWRDLQSERSEFGIVLMGLGNAYSALSNYNLAIPFYQEWLDILVKRNDVLERRTKAQCLYKLAKALFAGAPDRYQQILLCYQESLEIAVRSGDQYLELNNLLGLGNLYASRREYPLALEYYERQINLARELVNTEAQIEGLPAIATAYKAIKQYAKAIELYRMHLSLVLGDYSANQDLRANSFESLAQIYQILGEYIEAKATYQDCLELGLELGIENPRQKVACLIGLGICSDRLGQFKEAISFYQEVEHQEHYPECLIHLANAHNSLGQYKDAVGFYEKALKLSIYQSDLTLQVKSLIGLGNVQNCLGKLVKAIQFYEQAWELSKDIPDQKAIALGNLGNVYNALGQYQEALELYKQSLAIAKEVNDLEQQAHCLTSLGQVLDRMGDYAQALQFYQEWIDLKKAMGDRSATLLTLNRSSNLAVVNTKYAQAIEFHQQWIEVKRKMGDRQGEANSLGNLGNAFFALGQYPQAIQSYQHCLEIARTISDRRSEASSLSGLGSAFFVLGQYTQAIEFHERSLTISQKIDDFMIQARTYTNLGKAYYSLGQYAQAAEKYLNCLELIQKIGNRQGEANVLGDLGNAHYALGKYAQAISFYQQWLEISAEIGDRSQQGNALGGLGNSHNALGQYARAVGFYQQWLEIAQEISDRRSQANALAGLGNAYNALGEYDRAIDFHQQSLKIQKENSDRLTDPTAWAKFADTLESLEQKSLTTNPYKSIEVAASDRDDSAIQQLLAASAIFPKDTDIKKQTLTGLKPRTVIGNQSKPASSDPNWLSSTFDWLTGKKS